MAEDTEADVGAGEMHPDSERISMDNMRLLENIDVVLTVEVGSAEIKIRDLLRLNEGSVIELDRLAGDPLDILANGTMIAKGEVVWAEPAQDAFAQAALPRTRAWISARILRLTE